MIFDCITFFQELDLLELRLEEHSHFVDKFIITESGETFTGLPKKYILEENASRFSKFFDKIVYNKIPAWNYDVNSAGGVNWGREYWQKNQFYPTLKSMSDSNDIVIISDLDEIIRKENINKVDFNFPNVFMLRLYTFKMNLACVNDEFTNRSSENLDSTVGEPFWWFGPASWRVGQINENYWPQIRNRINTNFVNRINDGGWHYTYCVPEDNILTKLSAYSHADAAKIHKVNNINSINLAIKERRELTYCERKVKLVELNPETAPEYLLNNKEKFKHLLVT